MDQAVLSFVHRWIGRPSGALVTYRLAQALTGYEAFNEYIHRFGITASPGLLIAMPRLMTWPPHFLFVHSGTTVGPKLPGCTD